jgi:hypothetical protein
MARLRFTDVQARPTECLGLSSLRFDEFQQLVEPFEAAWRTLGAAPARSRTARAQRFGLSETDAASVISSQVEEEPAPVAPPEAPLWPLTGRNGVSSTPKTLLKTLNNR